jgi:protein arginine N-methyltransferase 3
MQEGIYDEARIEVVPKESVCGKPYPFKVLDLMTVKKEELFFTEKWESTLDKDIDMLDGFLVWFDNHFNTHHDEPAPAAEVTPEEWNKQKQGNVAFSTGPFTTPTHWKQGYLLMPPDDSRKDLKAGTKVTGEIIYTAAEDNARALTVGVKWAINDQGTKSRAWKMK